MAKKINIAELDILTDKFIRKAFEVKKRIEEIRIKQKDLEKDSPKFTKNTADLKRLNAEYNKHLKASNALLAPYDKLVSQFKQASERARNLAAQYGVNSRQAKRAAIEAGALRKKIEEIKVASSTTTGGLTKLGTSIKNAFSRFVGFTLISTAIFGFISALRNAIRVVVEYDRQLIAVGKTTNLSRKETRALGQEFINLGLSLKGISIQNLLKSAEIAGQLGIRGSENIKKFSETIERLALTSNIAGEESARNFAKFIQVSSDTIENADRLGSVITDLGNNFATTEKQILESATDIQGALVAYNVSAKGVLALASATSSLGLSSELSRSGIQRIFKVLNEGINTGKNLNEILRITGLTQEEISKQFEDDSLVVFDKFVNGLKNASEGGENLSLILKDLGLNEKRTEIVTSVLAKRTNVLNDAIKRSSDEYANNKALQDESSRASESLSAKIGDLSDAWSAFVLTIEEGSGGLSKAFKFTVDGLTGFIDKFRIAEEASSGFFDFLINAAQITPFGNENILNAQKKLLDAEKERKKLAEELVSLLEKEAEKNNTKIDKQQLINEFTKLNIEQLKEQIKATKEYSDVDNATTDTAIKNSKKVIIQRLLELDSNLNKNALEKKSFTDLADLEDKIIKKRIVNEENLTNELERLKELKRTQREDDAKKTQILINEAEKRLNDFLDRVNGARTTSFKIIDEGVRIEIEKTKQSIKNETEKQDAILKIQLKGVEKKIDTLIKKQIREEELNEEDKANLEKFNEEKIAIQDKIYTRELERIANFEQRKRELINEIALQNAETDEEKALLKETIDLENYLLELETLKLRDDEKHALAKERLKLYLSDIENITNKSNEKKLKDRLRYAKQEERIEKEIAKTNVDIAKNTSKLLQDILGDSLLAKILSVVGEAIASIARVKAETAASKATNLALATAMSAIDPTAVQRAQVRNTKLSIQSKILQAQIIASGAFELISQASKSKKKFEKGGLQEIGGKRHYSGGTKFYGEDGTQFEAEKGELIGVMSRSASKKFKEFNDLYTNNISFGSKLQDGGIIEPLASTERLRNDVGIERLAESISEKINNIKIVAIDSDIDDALTQRIEIIQDADI